MTLMRVSRNLHAETLLKTLGAGGGREGSTAAGRGALVETLGAWGIAPGSVIVSDGSGLSLYNYVTPGTLVAVLRHVAGDARFDATLPVAGRDGTISGRMRGTAAEGTVHAKDGSMSNVRALSGYLRTRDGERLVFSMIANNFDVAPAAVDAAMDAALVRLAGFSRGPR